jgi:CheY-like chemotaxis protein
VPELQHIPVIMLSMVDDRNLGFSLGAAEYMTKPIDRRRLVSLLHRFTPTGGGGTVLIIDDDADMRELIRLTVEDSGIGAAEAGNGVEALDWLARNPAPSLVLLDLLMPEMDGFEFLAQLRSRPQSADLPIVVLTAKDLSESERGYLARNTLLILNKSAQPIETLGSALAAIAEGGERRTRS